MVTQGMNGHRIASLCEPELHPVAVEGGHRTYRTIVPEVWPLSDLRCFPTIRIVPVPNKPYLRATVRIRVVEVSGELRLEANLLDIGFWDSQEAAFWQAQLCISEGEATTCEALALTLVV